MRIALLALVGCVVAGCTPTKAIRGSSMTFLTPAGASIALVRPAAELEAVVEQLLGERGFTVTRRAPTKKGKVLFFSGTRDRLNRRYREPSYAPSMAPPPPPGPAPMPGGISRDVGSWFAVRVTPGEQGVTTLIFYGKPMVLNAEGCADSDSDLRDAEYTCNDLRLRADWSGFALTDGREETQVITGIIAVLGEQFPLAPR
jgi:hypothetical protein